MKAKILKIVIYITGFICLYLFIAVRVLPMYNTLLVEKLVPGYWDLTKYGELYYFNFIKDFREKNLPKATVKHQLSSKQADINETEIFTFGDSFLDISRSSQFPTYLSEKLNKKVHFGYYDYPLEYLKKEGYRSNGPKVLIMGIVERYIPMKFTYPHDTIVKNEKSLSKPAEIAKNIKDLIFYKKGEKMFDALLKRSFFSTGIYSEIATLKFKWFGYISSYTPVYSTDDTIPWLFIDDEVDGNNTSFYYNHSDAEIENICNNIEGLAEKLKKIHNIELVFIPIPAKFTLYHNIVSTDSYNNFIPRIQENLKQRNVNFVNIYSDFKNSSELLYYGTDAHWNEKGMKRAVDLTVQYLTNKKLIN